jgi:hypothetical protein
MRLSGNQAEPPQQTGTQPTPRQVAWICAAIALLVSIVTVLSAMWAAGGKTSGLVRIPREEPLGVYVAERNQDWHFVQAGTRYDGLYYYTIALDPLARGAEHTLIDAPAYRYGHVAHGWMAGVLSLGSATRLPFALILLGVAGMVIAAYAGSRLAMVLGLTPWLGLAVVVNPGLLYALTVDTPETTGAAVMALGMWAWLRGRVWTAGVLFVLLCLIKEAFVFVPLGLAIWEVAQATRTGRDRDLGFRLGVLALGPMALLAWFVYLHSTLGLWPFAEGPANLAAPIIGWAETLRLSAQQGQGAEFQVGAAGLPILIGVGVGLIAGIVKASKLRGPVDAIFMLSAGLIFCLSWLALLYPKDLIRNVSALVFLAPYLWARVGSPEPAGSGGTLK